MLQFTCIIDLCFCVRVDVCVYIVMGGQLLAIEVVYCVYVRRVHLHVCINSELQQYRSKEIVSLTLSIQGMGKHDYWNTISFQSEAP